MGSYDMRGLLLFPLLSYAIGHFQIRFSYTPEENSTAAVVVSQRNNSTIEVRSTYEDTDEDKSTCDGIENTCAMEQTRDTKKGEETTETQETTETNNVGTALDSGAAPEPEMTTKKNRTDTSSRYSCFQSPSNWRPVGYFIAIGDFLDNFVDSFFIATAFSLLPRLDGRLRL